MKNMKNLYKAHAAPAALLYSFDGFSISGDYDTGLNENKTVCEHVKIGKFGAHHSQYAKVRGK